MLANSAYDALQCFTTKRCGLEFLLKLLFFSNVPHKQTEKTTNQPHTIEHKKENVVGHFLRGYDFVCVCCILVLLFANIAQAKYVFSQILFLVYLFVYFLPVLFIYSSTSIVCKMKLASTNTQIIIFLVRLHMQVIFVFICVFIGNEMSQLGESINLQFPSRRDVSLHFGQKFSRGAVVCGEIL